MIHLRHLPLTLLLALAAPAAAQSDYAAPVISRLEAEGFVVTEVKRTLLGRTLIVSQNRRGLREVVLNRHTGEVLRDRMFARSSPQPPQTSTPTAPAAGPTGTAGSGNGGDNGASSGNGGAGAGGGGSRN